MRKMQELSEGFLEEYFNLEPPVKQKIHTLQPPPLHHQQASNDDKSELLFLTSVNYL